MFEKSIYVQRIYINGTPVNKENNLADNFFLLTGVVSLKKRHNICIVSSLIGNKIVNVLIKGFDVRSRYKG